MKEENEQGSIKRLQNRTKAQTQKAPSRLDSGRKIYHKYSQNEDEIMKHPEYMDTVVCLYAKGLCTFHHRLCETNKHSVELAMPQEASLDCQIHKTSH